MPLRIGAGLVLVEIVGLPHDVAGGWLELRGLKVELYATGI
ncbi:hypothetical protein [Micromonospora pisi]|nr:hypothetical protein [Micromonospora pisi]